MQPFAHDARVLRALIARCEARLARARHAITSTARHASTALDEHDEARRALGAAARRVADARSSIRDEQGVARHYLRNDFERIHALQARLDRTLTDARALLDAATERLAQARAGMERARRAYDALVHEREKLSFARCQTQFEGEDDVF